MVDVAVEAADGVPAEALGLAGQGAQRGVHGGVREKGLGVLHGRLAPELSVGGRRRHGDGRRWTNYRGCARYLLMHMARSSRAANGCCCQFRLNCCVGAGVSDQPSKPFIPPEAN